MPPIGRVPIRKFLSLAAAVIVVSFAWIIAAAPFAHAEDAKWKGESIVYEDHQYRSIGKAGENDSHGLPKGSSIYSYVEPSEDGKPAKAHLLYFEPGANLSDATSAKLVTYTYTPPYDYSNPSGEQTVKLQNQLESGAEENATACVYEGVGWFICPITNFMADAVDWIFGILSNFLTVRPLSTDQDSALYRAWSIMRDFANVAFAIAFMIIIYAQVTSTGISNYGIKRTLPRLIIAAILVNISYWICAVAVDASNIGGVYLQNLFMAMRDQITGGDGNGWDIVSWKSVTTAILSGGTIATAGVVGLISVGSVVGALYYLLPVLLGVLISAIIALIIMAARQAIITILIIVSPLAFVAFLLPNTEKLFDKWRGLMTTMLMLFPIFSVLFGGSQVAGIAIIQNADTIIMVILGMAVQVAPLVVLPFLIKFGGSLMGRIAGVINDKKKGLLDRTSDYAKNQATQKKTQVLANPNLRRRNLLSRAVQGVDQRRRRREGWQKVNEAMADARWMEGKDHHRIDTANREAERLKKTIEGQHDLEWNARFKEPEWMKKELELRVISDRVEVAKAQADTTHAEIKAFDPSKLRDSSGNIVAHAPRALRDNPSLVETARMGYDTAEYAALTGMRKEVAARTQQQNVANALLTDDTKREYAGGIRGIEGRESAFAQAIRIEREEYGKNIKAKSELMKHFNLDSAEYQQLALGKDTVTRTDSRGHTYTFNLNDDFTREAAIDHQLGAGSFGEIETIIKESGDRVYDSDLGQWRRGATNVYATSVSSAIHEKKLSAKAGYFGSQTISDVAQGRILGDDGLNGAAIRYIQAGKVGSQALSGMSPGALKRMFQVNSKSDAEILEMDIIKGIFNEDTTDADKRAFLQAFRENSSALKYAAHEIVNSDILRRNAEKASLDVLIANASEPPTS